MVDRIREILSARQLTPTQFADTIGVARPIVSHILSGRNKPSLEVVQKIIAAFPGLSLSWLLSGTGSMNANDAMAGGVDASSAVHPSRRVSTRASETTRPTPDKAKTQSDKAEPIVKAPETLNKTEVPLDPANTLLAKETASLPLFATSTAAPLYNNQVISAPTPPALRQAAPILQESAANNHVAATKPPTTAEVPTASIATSAPSAAQPFAEPGKAIRRIVIFYQDGTFTDYQPDNK
ncbi:helix-turn-helix domain-containing protein [Hymenobacter volaticus]|uniref:Helix-turn-helix domain-containing protein n=1 Tax=Hymenobacter volaticus TaxID=2932254 RepID=A0ABY4G0U2_9BACT|nr:helix-turn-helix transcriptional regulator [Hymenobacter volaticus]UOQ64495.1 helix-turn-helix domain-containing protein [Hymenobacter volaticus]